MTDGDLDSRLVDGIRAAMKLSKVSMRALSERTGLPYRSLQNYLSGTTRMPASVYVQMCQQLGIDNQFVLERNFQLRYHPLWDALHRVLGDALVTIRHQPITDRSDMGKQRERQRNADALAHQLSSAYDFELQEGLRSSHFAHRERTTGQEAAFHAPKAEDDGSQ